METCLLSIFYSKFYFSFVDILHDICTHVATVQMVYLEPVRCDMKFVIIQIKADKAVSAVLSLSHRPFFLGFYKSRLKQGSTDSLYSRFL